MDPRNLPQTWPNRAQGRVVAVGPHRWWVVDAGTGPVLLLLHGTGASGHSFHRLLPHLTPHFRVVMPDLPGQGASQSRAFHRMGLDAMAEDLLALCDAIGAVPQVVVGHSAGAALALRIGELRPLQAVVAINAALGRFEGAAGFLFPLIARAMAITPFVSRAAAALLGRPDQVRRLLSGTGSALDDQGRALYLRLVQDPDHVAGALAMMAAWKLDGLMDRLPEIGTPTLLIATEGDRAVPPRVSRDAAKRVPGAELVIVPGYGHLPQEEAADGLASVMVPWILARLELALQPASA